MMAFLASVSVLAACAPSDSGVTRLADADRMEEKNRRVHEFNKKIDKNFLRPSAAAASKAIPPDLGQSVENFVDNLSLPSDVVNGLLQGNIKGAFTNTVRFALNTTLGFAGLFDAAGDLGVHADETDFGETLHVWGVGEGDYLEVPFMGPSTSRDVVGKVVDLFTNPLTAAMPAPEKYYATGLKVVAKVNKRGRYGGTVDSVLYESADSYTQTKLFYLQNRRHELGDTAGSAYVDVYEDPYAE